MDNNVNLMSADDIIKSYSSLVRKIAFKIISRLPPSVLIDDLLQVGLMAVIEAARNYDSTKGASFETYATIRIRGSMIDEIRREDWLPRSSHRSSKLLSKANDYIANNNHNNKAITSEELCQHLSISPEELIKLEKNKNNFKVYHFDDIGIEQENFFSNEDDKDIFRSIENTCLRQAINQNLELLPVNERVVLILYYDNEMSLKQIGEILSLTESRVCQLHSQAVEHLEKRMRGWL